MRQLVGFLALAAALAGPVTGQAQITLDGSLGPAGSLAGPNFVIDADLGQQRGGNLFHSFGQFNVRTGESATFTGPPLVTNILGRVTGGSASSIDGLLRSVIPGANLFLVNPAGVVFGPNAALDVGGSFHVTTADFVRMTDGGVFHASLARPTVLTVAPPAAFGFLAANPAPIAVEGSLLSVPDGRTLSLVGGGVAVTGGALAAPSGRIGVVSVAAPVEVSLDATTQKPDLGTLSAGGRVDLDGAILLSVATAGGGQVVIRGGRLRATGGSVMQSINAGDADADPAGIDVRVAGDVVLDDSRLQTGSFGGGRGGDVAVTADAVTLMGRGQLGTFAFGPGAGGAVRVAAGTSVALLSEAATILSIGTGTGDAGPITMAAPLLSVDGAVIEARNAAGRGGDIVADVGRLDLRGGGFIQSLATGVGNGGGITVRASESVSISGTSSLGLQSGLLTSAEGSGLGGALFVATPTLVADGGVVGALNWGSAPSPAITLQLDRALLSGGAFITNVAAGSGAGGDVVITASDVISLTGLGTRVSTSAADGTTPGRVVLAAPRVLVDATAVVGSPAGVAGTARAGDVLINAGELLLTSGGSILSGTLGEGAGGTVVINARESVTVAGQDDEERRSSISSFTAGAGDAGRITIATPLLTIDAGQISTGTSGPGRGGDLTLNVGRLVMSGAADVGSSALVLEGGPGATGPSGTIAVNAAESVALSGSETAINALTNSAADAGRILVSSPVLTVSDGAVISAATDGPGHGGGVVIDVSRLSLTEGGLIDSTTLRSGAGGTVTVTATESVSISGRDPVRNRASRLSSNSQGTGPGGDVVVRTPTVLLSDGGALEARSLAEGNAGSLTVVVADAFRSMGGSVTTEAAQGEGGNVVITATNLVHLVDSRITTSVRGGQGAGGNITIDPRFAILKDSEIRADAFGGPGGNVRIVADVFLVSGSVLSASSALGVPGVIDVQAPITDVSGSLAKLPESVLQAASLLREACRVRLAEGSGRSSLVLRGRGALPPEPGTLLPSPPLDPVLAVSATAAAPAFSPIVLGGACR